MHIPSLYYFVEVLPIPKNEHMINEEIRDKEVRLIDENGEQRGIMSAAEAYDLAVEAGLDLVKIAPNAVPPVCRIMDYGKFRFEQAKKLKEARKNQNIVDIKEVKLSVGIGDHDYDFKLRAAIKFLSDGDKVKASIRFRGREMSHMANSKHILDDFAEKLADVASVDKPAKVEGRSLVMFLTEKRN